MRFKVYLDEDIPGSLAKALRNRGIDVQTTSDAGNLGRTDEEQLDFAIRNKRVLFTCNKKDFILLHREYVSLSKVHFGIVLVTQDQVGIILKSILKLHAEVSLDDMLNRLEFLSSWK